MAFLENAIRPPEFYAPDTGSGDNLPKPSEDHPQYSQPNASSFEQPDHSQEPEADTDSLSLQEQLELWLRRKHADYDDETIRRYVQEYMADELYRDSIDVLRQIDEEMRRDRPDLPWINWYDR